MKQEIISLLSDPRQLEQLYRRDKVQFRRGFTELYPNIRGNAIADTWYERLHYEADTLKWGVGRDLIFVIVLAALAGIVAKLPDIFQINEELFYSRNAGFIIFPALCAFFVWKNKLPAGSIAIIAGVLLAGCFYINLLPDILLSDSILLSCLHLLIILWTVLGFAYIGGRSGDLQRRLDYLRYNGDLVVMTTLIVIAGGILSGVTIGLFSLIGIDIVEFYFRYIVIFGLPATPIIATYLVHTNPQLVGKVSPVIAKIFSPLVLAMLVIYLVAMGISGKDPYNDREFLMVFNVLLAGVMAIIFFSVAENSKADTTRAEKIILLLLAAVTVIVNCIALSAIIFRISTWGITPNRAAVLGANVLILVNLVWVTFQLWRVVFRKGEPEIVGRVIAIFLPIYCAWAMVVTFLFPLLFGYE